MTSAGTVVKASRRFIRLLADSGHEIEATSSTKALEITVGDRVRYTTDSSGRHLVSSVLQAKNCLERSFNEQTRKLATNLDHLYIVAATTPLFNTTFIDRVIAVCEIQDIPFTLIINKSDLKDSADKAFDELVDVYKRLGYSMLYTSAKEGIGIQQLEESISNKEFRTVAFTGISGVGKSSLIGTILPHFELRIGEVSKRTGQGRQTTSQPQAYRYNREDRIPLLVIDLPGVQNFGVSHLESSQITCAFIEIHKHSQYCQFGNCNHIQEKECGVLKAIQSGEIAISRYQSYIKILEEISAARRY